LLGSAYFIRQAIHSLLISMHILISYHRNISCLGVDDIAKEQSNLHQMAAGYEKKDFEHKKGI